MLHILANVSINHDRLDMYNVQYSYILCHLILKVPNLCFYSICPARIFWNDFVAGEFCRVVMVMVVINIDNVKVSKAFNK